MGLSLQKLIIKNKSNILIYKQFNCPNVMRFVVIFLSEN